MNLDELKGDVSKGKYNVPGNVYWNKEREEWWRQARDNERRFREDLIEALGLTGHPRAETLMNLAWEAGHSVGFDEVILYAEEFVDLLSPQVEWGAEPPTEEGCFWFHGSFYREPPETHFAKIINIDGNLYDLISESSLHEMNGLWSKADVPSPHGGER